MVEEGWWGGGGGGGGGEGGEEEKNEKVEWLLEDTWVRQDRRGDKRGADEPSEARTHTEKLGAS